MNNSRSEEQSKIKSDDKTNETNDNKSNYQEMEPTNDKPGTSTKDTTANDMTKDLLEGKGRIVNADKQVEKAFLDGRKQDSIPINSVDLKTVIANSVIATMQNVSINTPLRAIPLSSFVFGKVERTAQSSYGASPYVVVPTVPQLLKFVTLLNESQQVNLPDLLTMKFSMEGINETVAESIKLFNIATMTVRIELNDKLGKGSTILDPNSTNQGSLELQTTDVSGRTNPQASVNFIESRIFSTLSAFIGLDNVLVAMPQKQTCLDAVRGGPVAEALVRMPFYKGQYPHPYYSVYSNLPDWARQHFNEAFEQNPLQIGDMAVDSYAGMKLSQINKLVIDQWTAAVLRINFDKLRNHNLTSNTLQEKVRASLFKYDSIELEDLPDVESLTLLYNYSEDEYNLYMFRLLADKNMQLQVINFVNEELEKTNRLTAMPIEDVWKGIMAGDIGSSSFNQTWLSSINIGNNMTPVQMLVYETFSDFFTFNLSFSAIPSSLEAITEVLSILIFIVLYPKISQRMIHHLGFRLTQLFQTMYPKIYNNYRYEFGDVRTEFGKYKFESNGRQITRSESQQGYVYSIFTQTQKNKGNSSQNLIKSEQTLLTKFIEILDAMRLAILPDIFEYELDRKRIAKYPYMYENYTAYASWTPINHGDYQTNNTTRLGDRLLKIVSLSDALKELFTSQNPDSAQIPRGFNAYFSSWTNQLAKLVSSAGGTYQITCAMMQETLCNSPFFVGSRYNPNPKRFFYVPSDVGIGPLDSAGLSSTVIPTHINVSNFRVGVGMCLALTAEGEYLRNILIPYEDNTDMTQPNTRIRNDITALDGLSCFKMMNSLVSQSRNFGFAMQVAQWMVTPKDVDNPFANLVSEISGYMTMGSWMPLVRRIFQLFNVDYDTMFVRNVGESAFNLDGRYLDRTLLLMDATTSMPLKQQPLNSKFGFKFNYMVPQDKDKLNILCRPLLSMDSKIIYVHTNWYIGKLFVDELGPTQNNLKTTNWTDETSSFTFMRIAYKNGTAAQLQYKSDITKKENTLILPYTANNAPILLIKVEYLKEIPLTYLRVLAKAISQGKIILQVTKLKMRVHIEDMPSRTLDYSQPTMTEDDVYEVISQPTGFIMEHTFKTTHYASNFSSQALVCPGYIQWLASPEPADRNIFASTITNALYKPTQTILPTSDEMGYGLDEEGLRFPNGIVKTESNIVNWNNSIPTVSPSLVRDINLRIVPSIPQYMGAS